VEEDEQEKRDVTREREREKKGLKDDGHMQRE
jgi:hypothetical protein